VNGVSRTRCRDWVVSQDAQHFESFAKGLGIRIESMQANTLAESLRRSVPDPQSHHGHARMVALRDHCRCTAAKAGLGGAFIVQSIAGSTFSIQFQLYLTAASIKL